jgi:cytochrome c553
MCCLKGTGIMKNYLIIICLLIFTSTYSFAVEGDSAKGKTLSQTCTACHSVDGNSTNPIWPKLAGQHASYIVKQLNDFKKGNRVNGLMAAMVAPLSEQDMIDLGAYFSTQKTTLGAAKPELIEIGELIYRAGDHKTGVPACMACHGPNGAGNPTAIYPALSGQHAEYISIQLNMFKAEKRNNDPNNMMRTVARSLTDLQIEAVSQYIQGLH